jgi:hypothetical protein
VSVLALGEEVDLDVVDDDSRVVGADGFFKAPEPALSVMVMVWPSRATKRRVALCSACVRQREEETPDRDCR